MIIHTAWVGPKAMPEDFKRNLHTQSTWASWGTGNPGFARALLGEPFKCWDLAAILSTPEIAWVMDTPYWKTCMKAQHYAAACDLLRLVLLWNFGGMWCDGDVEVLRDPDQIFEDAWSGLSALVDGNKPSNCLHAAWEDTELLGTACIVAPHFHPVIGLLIERYKTLTYADVSEGGGTMNGPQRFTEAVIGRQRSGIVLHPTEVFYPSSWRAPHVVNITDRTIAWHKWAASWKNDADLSKWRYK